MAAELVDLKEMDRRELELLGQMMDRKVGLPQLGGLSAAEFLAETLLKVRGKDGKLHALKANAAQRMFERRRGLGNIVLKARQMGMTTWVAGRFLLKTITRPGTLTLQVAHTQESAEEILQIVHRFLDHLPEGLQQGALRTSKASVRQIVFPEIDSEYRVVSAADRNAGRGMTVQNLHCSEVSRWPGDAAETLAGLRASLAIGEGVEAEQVLESTPCGVGGCFYEEWVRAGTAASGFSGGQWELVRHFFPWWMDAGYSGAAVEEASLTEEERELMGRVASSSGGLGTDGLSLEQIGFRRGMRSGMGGLARQEYVEDPEACFLASGDPFFDMEAVEARLKLVHDALRKEKNGQLEVWMPPIQGKTYLVAVDPSGGGADGDFTAMQVLDVESGMQCAEYAGHWTGIELAREAADLAWQYNRGWIVVERNSMGSGVLWLLEQTVGYRAIYRGMDGQAGWLTSSVSRPAMLARMAAALVEEPGVFQSRNLLVECRSFVRLANGGVGARSGAHDDRVMAMAIGLGARVELVGKKLPRASGQ